MILDFSFLHKGIRILSFSCCCFNMFNSTSWAPGTIRVSSLLLSFILNRRSYLSEHSEQRKKKKENPCWKLACQLSSHPTLSRSSLYVIVKDKEICDADFSFCPSESGSQRSVLIHYLYLKWNPLYPGLFPVLGPFDHL